ncbi:Ltp family lipoprotein [Gordonia terrae]|uniref:Ltp family lipoprotein n=1 Tax=Gordonia terrae TaxID=2055 RepID=UPI0003A5BD80|nr:Ltp family lipoprotein [Gordonia terrae]
MASASSSQVSGVSLNPMSTAGAESLATWEQTSAVAKAEEYLSLMAFSETGLIEQLEYEGFSTADATYAVGAVEAQGAVDWNEQAVYGVDNA